MLEKIPGQQKIMNEMVAYDKIIKENDKPISKAGGKYFYRKRKAGEQAYKLFYKEGINGKEVLLFDPQKYIEEKTMDYDPQVSDDGSEVLLNISEAGVEVGDIRIIDVAIGAILADIIPHSGWRNFVGGSNSEILYLELRSYDLHDPENMLNTS